MPWSENWVPCGNVSLGKIFLLGRGAFFMLQKITCLKYSFSPILDIRLPLNYGYRRNLTYNTAFCEKVKKPCDIDQTCSTVKGFHAQYVEDTKVTFSWDLPDSMKKENDKTKNFQTSSFDTSSSEDDIPR